MSKEVEEETVRSYLTFEDFGTRKEWVREQLQLEGVCMVSLAEKMFAGDQEKIDDEIRRVQGHSGRIDKRISEACTSNDGSIKTWKAISSMRARRNPESWARTRVKWSAPARVAKKALAQKALAEKKAIAEKKATGEADSVGGDEQVSGEAADIVAGFLELGGDEQVSGEAVDTGISVSTSTTTQAALDAKPHEKMTFSKNYSDLVAITARKYFENKSDVRRVLVEEGERLIEVAKTLYSDNPKKIAREVKRVQNMSARIYALVDGETTSDAWDKIRRMRVDRHPMYRYNRNNVQKKRKLESTGQKTVDASLSLVPVPLDVPVPSVTSELGMLDDMDWDLVGESSQAAADEDPFENLDWGLACGGEGGGGEGSQEEQGLFQIEEDGV